MTLQSNATVETSKNCTILDYFYLNKTSLPRHPPSHNLSHDLLSQKGCCKKSQIHCNSNSQCIYSIKSNTQLFTDISNSGNGSHKNYI